MFACSRLAEVLKDLEALDRLIITVRPGLGTTRVVHRPHPRVQGFTASTLDSH